LQDLVQITGFRATSDLPAWLSPAERLALLQFLQADPRITRMDRYRFQLDNRQVDFSTIEGLSPA
jgi:alpha-galactosidase